MILHRALSKGLQSDAALILDLPRMLGNYKAMAGFLMVSAYIDSGYAKHLPKRNKPDLNRNRDR